MTKREDPARPVSHTVDHDGRRVIDYSYDDFRRFWKSPSRTILDELERRIIADLVQPAGSWLVDVGCGFGRALPSYYSERGGFVLVDYALNHLQFAKDVYGHLPNVHFVAADAYRLPFESSAFNTAVSIRLFHHIEDPGAFLGELSRIVAGGGNLILSYLNRRNLLRVLGHGPSSFTRTHARVSEMIYATHPAYFLGLVRSLGNLVVIARRGSGSIHQAARAWKALDGILARRKSFRSAARLAASAVDAVQAKLNLSLMQFVKLRKRDGSSARLTSTDLYSILRCPRCESGPLESSSDSCRCPGCNAAFPVRDGIVDLR